MKNVLVEFNKDFTLMDIHANFSLSSYISILENTYGVVFASQPSIYDIEVYLDRNIYKDPARQRVLKASLGTMFTSVGIQVDYVQN